MKVVSGEICLEIKANYFFLREEMLIVRGTHALSTISGSRIYFDSLAATCLVELARIQNLE